MRAGPAQIRENRPGQVQPMIRNHPRPAGVLAALALVAAAGNAEAGAWLRPAGSYYFKLSASRLYTEQEYDYAGNKVDILAGQETLINTSYRDASVSAYLEYGLSDRVTLLATLPFKVLTARRTELTEVPDIRRDVDATNGGLSDALVAMKIPLLTTPFPIAVQGGVKLPLGYDDTPYNGGPPLGSSRIDVEAHLLAGVSFYPVPAWAGASVGYRVRGGDLDDQWLFGAEAGATWWRLQLKAGIDGLYSTSDPPDLAAVSRGGASPATIVTNQDVLEVTPAISYLVNDEISFVLETFTVVDGRNTVTGTTWSAGVVFQQ